jgi:hypothetical protein
MAFASSASVVGDVFGVGSPIPHWVPDQKSPDTRFLGAYGGPPKNRFDALYNEFQDKQNQSQAWNKERFLSALNNATGYQAIAKGNYDLFSGAANNLLGMAFDKSNQSEATANNAFNGMGISLNKWGAGSMTADSPAFSPQAAARRADDARNGLSGTTAGANGVVLGNSMDLANLYQRQFENAQSAKQLDANIMNSRVSAAGQLAGSSLGMYGDAVRETNRVNEAGASTGPDYNQLMQVAELAGQGDTSNMYAPAIGGGVPMMDGNAYGGFANAGYNVPGGLGTAPTQNWGAGGSYWPGKSNGGASAWYKPASKNVQSGGGWV